MTYHRDNDKRQKRDLFFLLLILVIFLFIYQHKIYSAFSGIILPNTEPVLQSVAPVKESVHDGFFSIFSFKNSLIAENAALKEKVKEDQAAILDHNRLLTENESLKAILGRKENKNLILAAILAKPNQSPYDTLILDVGEKNGVSIGAPIFAYGNILIGKISEVTENTSHAMLFSSSGEEYGAAISDKNIPLKLLGRGGGNFISKLPRSVPIEEGDQAYSVELNPHILGVVRNISSDPRDPFQTILLESPVNVSELSFIQILL